MNSLDRKPIDENEIVMIPANQKAKYRNNKRLMIHSEHISDLLTSRITPILTSMDQHEIHCIKDQNASQFINDGYGMYGTWNLDRLNPCFRLCKYDTNGHFSPHYDSDYIINPVTERSLKTFMIYLNDNYIGGETSFATDHELYIDEDKQISCSPESNIYAKLKAKQGDCLIFDHKILHEGLSVCSNQKYIMRTDIMYKKDITINSETLFMEQALQLYYEGMALEEQGLIDEGIRKYKAAFRLDPEIEKHMG